MTPLLIVSFEDRIIKIEDTLVDFAHPEALGLVKILGLKRSQDPYSKSPTLTITEEVIQLRDKTDSRRCAILIDKEVHCNTGMLEEVADEVDKQPYSAIKDTLDSRRGRRKPLLFRLCERYGLSILAYAESLVKTWSHRGKETDNLGEGQLVSSWLEQFRQLDRFREGEAILASLKVIDGAQLGSLLFDSTALHETDGFCLVADPETRGKSADVISNLLHKRFPHNHIYSQPAKYIEDGNTQPLHIFEDGLWTATESIGVLESLLGIREKRGQRNKVTPLKDPTTIANVGIFLHFGIASDYGLTVLRTFLKQHQLNRISIVSNPAFTVKVLTETGKAALKQNPDVEAIWKTGPQLDYIHSYICDRLKSWKAPKKEKDAKQFLETVGRQLFERYLEYQVETLGWSMWDADKLNKCKLGMWNLGLTFAFAHSVPKATLPLLWSEGVVTYKGQTIEWKPLFEHAR